MIQPPLTDVKVIVVEDTSYVRDYIQVMMKMFLNRDVPAFWNGQEAWDYINEGNPVHMIISDVNMPIMDGIKLLKKVKGAYPDIIFISMSARPENQEDAIRYGADAFIGKPFQIKDFVTIVKKFITGEE